MVKEEGNELSVRVGGEEGAPGWETTPPPPQVPGRLHGSLVSHLHTQRHPVPRAELWENDSRRPVFGLLPFCWGSPVHRGDPCVFLEDTPSVHLLQPQEQTIFLVQVLPLTRRKPLDKSLVLLEVNFHHW